MIGLDLRSIGELLEADEQRIRESYPLLKNEEAHLLKQIEVWIGEHIFCDCDDITADIQDFFVLVLSGEFKNKYQAVYQKMLHWRKQGLQKTQVVVILGQLRQLLIGIGARLSPELAKSYCHILDVTIGLVVTIYQIDDDITQIKHHMQSELKRIDRNFAILGADVPLHLTRPYVDHNKWLLTVMELTLGDIKAEGIHLQLDEHKCRLGLWLDNGGIETFSENIQQKLADAHHRVHQLAQQAIDYAKEGSLDKILDIIHDLRCASEEVSEILLDLVEETFVKQAISDGLTGLPNRRLFDSDFKKRRAFSHRHQYYLGLIVLDIDHFKAVNDTYGHLVGDKVLQKMSDILQTVVREEETVYRWGGEEFAVLLVSPVADAAEHLAERIRQAVEKTVFCAGTSTEMHKTVSGGALSMGPNIEQPAHELFSLTDKLLYQAKTNGRNQIVSQVLDE